MANYLPKSGPKSLSNLANLLPTGTVLTFHALVTSFSNNGSCLPANKYLTLCLISFCSAICFFSSFTDSFTGRNGKLYYGIATVNGLYIFTNDDDYNNKAKDVENGENAKEKRRKDDCNNKAKDVEYGEDEKEKHRKDDYNNKVKDVENGEDEKENHKHRIDLNKYKIRLIDFVHAFSSLLVFLVLATSGSEVQRCFFPRAGANGNTLMMNLPFGVGALASLLFMLFPTTRRGIGYADNAVKLCPKCNSRTSNYTSTLSR